MMKCEKNVGQKDKRVRLGIALVLILVGLFANLGALEPLMGLVAVVLIVTSFLNFCPAYALMGKNTCGTDSCCGVDKGKSDEKKPSDSKESE